MDKQFGERAIGPRIVLPRLTPPEAVAVIAARAAPGCDGAKFPS
jgi:hypothetical protein